MSTPDNTPRSRPIPPGTLIDDLKPSRFLKVEDLTERWNIRSLTITISRATWEDTVPNPKDLDPTTADAKHPKGKPRIVTEPAFYFKGKTGNEWPSAYLLSAKVDVKSIKAATNAKTIDELTGKRVTIIVSEFRNDPVLRISPEPPASQSTQQTPANGHNQPKPIEGQTHLERLKALAETDIITAYTEAWKAAGLDNQTQQAILKEYTGDFAAAFDKIIKDYAYIIG